MPPNQAERMRNGAGTTVFDVFPENWVAVTVFCASVTQWRTRGNSIIGLDYTAVALIMRWQGITDEADTFRRLQIIEAAVLTIFQSQSDAHGH